jgi:signal recognition particle GTPase
MMGEQVGLFSVKKTLKEALKDAIKQILSIDEQFDILQKIEEKKKTKEPYVILFWE